MTGSLLQRISISFRNSHLHYLICRLLAKFEMEGLDVSYSQCGEDLILKSIFGKNKKKGFYIDIGCNNPIQKSNTFKLYLKGWSGICVDGNPRLIQNFISIRKRDKCLEAIVSNSIRPITFYQDNIHHELSSVSEQVGSQLKLDSRHVAERKVMTTTLEKILDDNPPPEIIDLLCIDVEEHDLEVLKGNNFEKYRPAIICVEYGHELSALGSSDIHVYLKEKGYELLSFSRPNAYYEDIR